MTDAKVNIERELELIDGMIEVQLHHAEQCDHIANRTMAEKQKGWDMERVALLRKMRAALAAQPADAQFEDDLIESVGQMQRGEVARVWQPAEPVAWLWRLNHSGKAFFMVADSTLREVLTDAFPVYAAPPAPAAVPLTDDQLRTDLISCRGTVKSELNHYERLTMVHGKTVVAENYEREAQRLSDLLDRIDALIAASGDKP